MNVVIKKRRPRALKTTSAAGKKRKLVAKKIATESTLRVAPQRTVSDRREDLDDQRAWMDLVTLFRDLASG